MAPKKPVASDDDDDDVEEIEAGDMLEMDGGEAGLMDDKEDFSRLLDPDYAEKFVATLDPVVQGRVRALQGMQGSLNEIRDKYLEEHKAIEKKYEALYAPIFDKRLEIISGDREPSAEEVTQGKGEDFKEAEGANTESSGAKGIPEFWLTALNKHDQVTEILEERDEECLKSLTNIVGKCFDDPDKGFMLEFTFAENEFFTNTLLTKTYHLMDEEEIVLDKAEGCDIDWKPSKNLTVVTKKKKQKAKGGKQTRTVTKEEPCDSFFNFFKPPQIPEDEDEDEDEDMDEQLEELMEQDYEIGCAIKDQVIPKAVMWFTGEACSLDADDSDDEDFGDLDDHSDDDDDDEPRRGKKGGKKGGAKAPAGAEGAQPECKQQ